MNITYDCFYEDGFLNLIKTDFGNGIFEDYLFDCTKINDEYFFDKLMYKDKTKDSIYLTVAFGYDDKGKLVTLKETAFETILESMEHRLNSVTVRENNYASHNYALNNLRFISEETIYPARQLRAKVNTYERKNLKTTVKYFYRENGLIDYTEINSGGGSKVKGIYEYSYYD
jgi:hypothetical protein